MRLKAKLLGHGRGQEATIANPIQIYGLLKHDKLMLGLIGSRFWVLFVWISCNGVSLIGGLSGW
jgi:hypothetical protein